MTHNVATFTIKNTQNLKLFKRSAIALFRLKNRGRGATLVFGFGCLFLWWEGSRRSCRLKHKELTFYSDTWDIFVMRLKPYLLSAFIALLMIVTSCATNQSANAQLSDAQFESKVLEIMRKNPKVILDSVQDYQRSQTQQQEEAREKILSQIRQEPRLLLRNSPVTGSASQKIIMAEFSDFECPYCAKAHTVVKEFMAKNGNEVTLVYKHFPLTEIHAEAEPAALASWAAMQQNKFWEYYDGLFEQQNKLGEDLYLELATKSKLDIDRFNRDRQSKEAKEAIKKDFELGKSLGVRGTPSFFVNGIFLSGVPDLKNLEDLLAQIKAGK
jgi:protein-disulfide isomerase